METPPLRVSRPVSACARCRSAKIRCDGKLPACSACERAGKTKDCSSANDQFAKGKERSYVASLESRIERLQNQIALYRNERGSPQSRRLNGGAFDHSERGYRTDASNVDELVSDFGYLSVNATASGYHGFTQEMSFARLVLSTACVTELPQASIAVLPPREFAIGLVQDCIQRVFTIYPVFSDTKLFGCLEAVYQHNGRYCPPHDSWNIRLIFAIASLGRSRVKGDVQYQNGLSHAAIALEQREAVLQPGSLGAVQALLLLVIYSILDPSHFDSWYLIGVAARVMVDIGLHQDPGAPSESRLKAANVEFRRRLFYCVYALDRLISMTHARCFSFTDDSMDVELPASANPLITSGHFHFATQGSTAPAVEIIKFRQIQSAAFQSLFGSSRATLFAPWHTRVQLIRKAGDWVSGLAESTPQSLKQVILSEMFYLNILLMKPPGGNADLGSYGIALLFEYCVGFVRNTWPICDQSWETSYLSNLDLLRTNYVAQVTLNILLNEQDSIFEAVNLQPPPIAASDTVPPLQRSGPAEKISQAINAITQLDEILKVLNQKFGASNSYTSFKQNSANALQKMYAIPQQRLPIPPRAQDTAQLVQSPYGTIGRWPHLG